MIRSALITASLFLTTAFANAQTVVTSDGEYTLSDNGHTLISVFENTDQSNRQPLMNGWGIYRAEPQDLYADIPAAYHNAELLGLYVKPCGSDVWENIDNTIFKLLDNYYMETLVPGDSYSFDVYSTSPLDAGREFNEYECGTSNVRDVSFSYVVKFTQENTCTAPQYVDQIAHEIPWASYATGEVVQNNGKEYKCIEGGWCTIGADYAPGVGWAWQNAWVELGACN